MKKNLIPQTITQFLCHNYDVIKWWKKNNGSYISDSQLLICQVKIVIKCYAIICGARSTPYIHALTCKILENHWQKHHSIARTTMTKKNHILLACQNIIWAKGTSNFYAKPTVIWSWSSLASPYVSIWSNRIIGRTSIVGEMHMDMNDFGFCY